MKVDFFVPGFSKCGTTTLCSLLAEHPEIFMPSAKEPRFFSDPEYMARWKSYLTLFRDADGHATVGEGTTFYSTARLGRDSCRRILKHFPEAKFIFIARDPIDRIESSYREFHNSGYKFGLYDLPLDLGDLLRKHSSIVQDTLFWARISDYLEQVSRDKIHVLFLEDLKARPQAELARCFDFLGVDPAYEPANIGRRLNSGMEKMHDTKLQRLILRSRMGRRWFASLPVKRQGRYRKILGSRKAFQEQIVWDNNTVAWVGESVVEDASAFLEFCGKPVDYWTRLERMRAAEPRCADVAPGQVDRRTTESALGRLK